MVADAGSETTETIIVSGNNLSDYISLAISGTDAAIFLFQLIRFISKIAGLPVQQIKQ